MIYRAEVVASATRSASGHHREHRRESHRAMRRGRAGTARSAGAGPQAHARGRLGARPSPRSRRQTGRVSWRPRKTNRRAIAARKAALEILFRVNHKGAYADALLGDRLPEFEPNDRGLITLMVLGTVAWRAQLDFEIERLASRPLAKIDAAVLEILRLATFSAAPSRSRPEACRRRYCGDDCQFGAAHARRLGLHQRGAAQGHAPERAGFRDCE